MVVFLNPAHVQCVLKFILDCSAYAVSNYVLNTTVTLYLIICIPLTTVKHKKFTREYITCYKCVTSCVGTNEMKRIWFSILLLYLLVTTWSFHNSIHPWDFEQLLGTRAERVLFSQDAFVFLNTFWFRKTWSPYCCWCC